MTQRIGRTYTFSAAHVILGHPKCGRMHGHNYRVIVEVEGPLWGYQNWIMDFGVLDEIVKPIINSLDHHFILPENQETPDGRVLLVADVVEISAPSSSAESLAEWIGKQVEYAFTHPQEDHAQHVHTVRVWETDRSYAEWTNGPA
jgi:6-pyruvoyl tetrahydropterin synthase/QueD family protein